MIFKIQRSLMPPDANALIYNEEKSIVYTVEVTEGMRKMMGDQMKGFYNAEIGKDGRPHFDGTKAEWQKW